MTGEWLKTQFKLTILKFLLHIEFLIDMQEKSSGNPIFYTLQYKIIYIDPEIVIVCIGKVLLDV